jgi:hypothetical protein
MVVYQWIIENKELMIALGVLLFALSLTGNLTQTIRAAKKGLKEAITPLGFIVLLSILYIAYLIYESIADAI